MKMHPIIKRVQRRGQHVISNIWRDNSYLDHTPLTLKITIILRHLLLSPCKESLIRPAMKPCTIKFAPLSILMDLTTGQGSYIKDRYCVTLILCIYNPYSINLYLITRHFNLAGEPHVYYTLYMLCYKSCLFSHRFC